MAHCTECTELQKKIQHLEQSLDSYRHRIFELQAELEALYGAKSWIQEEPDE